MRQFRFCALLLASLSPLAPATALTAHAAEPVAAAPQPEQPASKDPVGDLFNNLKKERDAKKARGIATEIVGQWSDSGSPTINLLMQWAEEANEQMETLQAMVVSLQEQLVTALQQIPHPPPPQQNPPIPQQIPPIPSQNPPIPPKIPPLPQDLPIVNEDWFRDPMPIQPQAPATTVLDHATLDKLAKIDRIENAMRKGKGCADYA